METQFNTQIYEEACQWFIECRAGDLDDIARAGFDRWLRKSPDHQSAYLEIAAIWAEGPTLDPANRWDLDTLIVQAADDSGKVVALERTPRLFSRTPQHVPPHQTSRANATGCDGSESLPLPARVPAAAAGSHRLFALAAASILLVTVACAIYLLAPRSVYATGFGEQRSLALNDGSTVQLNSLSKIRIRYTEHQRTVDLLQGQALFHVAKDTARPFIVRSAETRVKAVGTRFDVYRKADGTVVTVVEGRVAILGNQEPVDSTALFPERGKEMPAPWKRKGIPRGNNELPEPMPSADFPIAVHEESEGDIFLAAGEQITVTASAVRRTKRPDVAGATAWTQRQLVFDSATLTDVADEFNRYNQRKLVIDPSALGSQHISGVFSSTDPASLIRFLRDRIGLRVTETPRQIRVEKNPEGIFSQSGN